MDDHIILFEKVPEVESVNVVVNNSKTPSQSGKTVPPTNPVIEPVPRVPKVTHAPPTRASLKGAKAVVEEGGRTV